MQIHDPMADIQNSPDPRNLAVDRVGIRDLCHPIIFEDKQALQTIRQHSIAHFDMLVDLPKNVKGTHMSRFVEILNEQECILSIENLPQWLNTMVSRLQANYGYLQAKFPYFVNKFAPVSKAASLMNYDICLRGVLEKGQAHIFATIVIPVTSLCPCSKEIADYGAHNQRSHVTVTIRATPELSLIDIIQMVESKSSCELYGILKRADEKAVTERAYDNPRFVEDTVRDIAAALDSIPAVKGYKISSENFESIHNHSAYAEIDRLGLTSKTQQSGQETQQKARSAHVCEA